MLLGALVLLGVLSWLRMPQALFPDVRYPSLTVATRYEQASPKDMEELVTSILEESLNTVSGLKSMTSYSQEGLSVIMLSFRWGRSMDVAALQVREKIDLVKDKLPQDCEEPLVLKVNPLQMPLAVIAVNSPQPSWDLMDLVEQRVQPNLEKITGVASVHMSGGREQEILVQLDPLALQGRATDVLTVIERLKQNNLNYPAGSFTDSLYQYLVRSVGEFTSLDDIKHVVVNHFSQPSPHASAGHDQPQDQGDWIRLQDVASISRQLKPLSSYARLNGQEMILLSLQQQSQANIVKTLDRIKAELVRIEPTLPPGVQVNLIYDPSVFIRKALNSVFMAAIMGGCLAFVVLLFFLKNVYAALLVSFSIPLSLICAFVPMSLCGLSLNILSLGGLALGVGMMVDNAIVVMEHIVFLQQRGSTLKQAAVRGAEEMGGAITASTLTTIAVFGPMIYVQGLAGQLFGDFALSITFSLLASLGVAAIFLPRMVAFRARFQPAQWALFDRFERVLDELKWKYSQSLNMVMGHTRPLLMGLLVLLIVSLLGLAFVPRILLPASDQGQFLIELTLPGGTPVHTTNQWVLPLEQHIRKDPAVQQVVVLIGSNDDGDVQNLLNRLDSNQAQVVVHLKPSSEPTATVIERLKEELSAQAQGPIQFNWVEQDSSFQALNDFKQDLKVRVAGPTHEQVEQLAYQVVEQISPIAGVQQVLLQQKPGLPQTRIELNRDRLALYGFSMQQISQVAQTAIKGVVPTQLKEQGQQVDIRVLLKDDVSQDMSSLRNVRLYNGLDQQSVPLDDLMQLAKEQSPARIVHDDRDNVLWINLQVRPGSEKRVRQALQQRLAQIPVEPQLSVSLADNQELKQSFQSLLAILILSVVLVYMIMASQFESMLKPLVIIFTVPLALIGVTFVIYLFALPLSLMVLLGLVMLVGLVVNNGIVLIDYIQQLKAQGLSSHKACVQGAAQRLRPILMTSATTILGLLPLALGLGRGTELGQPMAITVIGGLIFSTALTLYVIPLIFLALDRLRREPAS